MGKPSLSSSSEPHSYSSSSSGATHLSSNHDLIGSFPFCGHSPAAVQRNPQRFRKFAAAAKGVSIAKHAAVDVRLEVTPLPE
jgi:hypothetical protein